MMELTKSDYYELEKLCDMAASQMTVQTTQVISKLTEAKVDQEKVSQMFKDFAHAYDRYRTISAKLEAIRNERQQNSNK
jgi:hypothetical protein